MANILLVDDLRLFLELEKRYLEHTNADVFTAETARKALEILSREKIDLLFLDYLLPDMKGTDCLKLIRSNEKTKTLPVVLVSSEENRDICRSSGCDDFLAKPLNKDKFLDTISKFLPIMVRKDERLEINLKITFTFKERTYQGVTNDLSRSGLFINTVPPLGLAEGDVVSLNVKLPSKWGMELFEAEGNVVSIKNEDVSSKGLGVKFTKVDEESRKRLYYFLEKMGY